MPSQASDAFAGMQLINLLMPAHSSDAFTSDAFTGNQAMQAHACLFFLFLGRLDASIMTRGPSLHRLAFAGTIAGRIMQTQRPAACDAETIGGVATSLPALVRSWSGHCQR